MTLKQKAVSGIKWTGVSMAVVTALQFITLAVLARYLAPFDFGLMGMIMVVMGFAQAFADMGISNAIIHRQDATRDQLSSLYWLNMLVGVLVFCIIWASTPLVVIFYREPRLYDLLHITAVIFLITPVAQQFQILLQKNLNFNGLAKIEMATALVNSTVSIGAGMASLGVYALVYGQLAGTIARVALLCGVGWRDWHPSLHFSRRDLKGYVSFGLYQMGERTVNYLSAHMDYIIIGRFLGPAALGFYTLAYQLVTFPLTKVNPVITKVIFPVFSIIQNDNESFRKGYVRVINYIAFITFPMLIGLFIVAPEFIILLFGERWVASAFVLQILCMVGLFKSLGNPVGAVLLAKGRADIGFYWNVFIMIIVGVAVIIGVNWGINGVAIAILLLQIPLFLIIQPIVNRLIDLKMIQYLKPLFTPLVCSLAMLAGIFLVKRVVVESDAQRVFAISVTVGVLIYTAALYIKDKNSFWEVVSLIKGN
ncbi:MAG: MOP flippase family protein [Deltaproteobacteria bacterium]|nr:MOP flippase family protein [Deltaproteobacteria bacterium]